MYTGWFRNIHAVNSGFMQMQFQFGPCSWTYNKFGNEKKELFTQWSLKVKIIVLNLYLWKVLIRGYKGHNMMGAVRHCCNNSGKRAV